MKRILVSVFVATVLVGICVAQSAQSQASGTTSQETSASAAQSGEQAASASQLQAGSTVQAELAKSLDARKAKVGDEVVAKTTHDVKSNGHVVIPKGSKLIGHVTEAKAHSSDEATSAVGIAFDRAVLKNGTEMPLAMSIQAIGRSQASAAAMEDNSMTSGNAGAMGSPGAHTSGNGGLIGGVASTAGGAVNTAGSAAGGAVHTVGTAGGAVTGSLSSTSQGVVGMPGLSLSTDTATSTHASVINSNGSNVHLDSGTEMVLRVNQ